MLNELLHTAAPAAALIAAFIACDGGFVFRRLA